ncbi:Eco57I restriction-modification methylase [Ruminococcaceae bacterium YAD3003]|nr:Eco57I restriction-modification methylase [Ruminococcaceae bacterium YAD3003]
MKFDYCIGNPPYQLSADATRDQPIYGDFMEAAYTLSDKVELITPGKFLFDAGATNKEWNSKMLNDSHLKVLSYEPNAKKVFSNVGFSGGVVITYRDTSREYGAIGFFSVYKEINTILDKVKRTHPTSFSSIMYGQGSYKFSSLMHQEHPEIRYNEDENGNNIGILSKGHDNDIATSALDKLDKIIMFEDRPNDGFDYIKVLGRKNNERAYSYIRRDYIGPHPNLDTFKVVFSNADGAAGTIGNPIPARIIGKPSILKPGEAYTQTFIGIGCFATETEAINVSKYIKTRFCRTLLGALKATQHIPPEKWKYVPLLTFTENPNIDWSTSIDEIDSQLYTLYGLKDDEILFIKTHIKEME